MCLQVSILQGRASKKKKSFICLQSHRLFFLSQSEDGDWFFLPCLHDLTRTSVPRVCKRRVWIWALKERNGDGVSTMTEKPNSGVCHKRLNVTVNFVEIGFFVFSLCVCVRVRVQMHEPNCLWNDCHTMSLYSANLLLCLFLKNFQLCPEIICTTSNCYPFAYCSSHLLMAPAAQKHSQ